MCIQSLWFESKVVLYILCQGGSEEEQFSTEDENEFMLILYSFAKSQVHFTLNRLQATENWSFCCRFLLKMALQQRLPF